MDITVAVPWDIKVMFHEYVLLYKAKMLSLNSKPLLPFVFALQCRGSFDRLFGDTAQ